MYVLMTTDDTYDFKSLLALVNERHSAFNIALAYAYYGGDLDMYLEVFPRQFITHSDDTSHVHAFDIQLDDERNEDVFYIHSGVVTDEIFNEITLRRLQQGKPINFEHLRLSATAIDIGRVIQLMLEECAAFMGLPERIYGLEATTSSRIVPTVYYGKRATGCKHMINSKLDI